MLENLGFDIKQVLKIKRESICISGWYHWSVFTVTTLYLIPHKNGTKILQENMDKKLLLS